MNKKYRTVRFMNEARPPKPTTTIYNGDSNRSALNFLDRDLQMRQHDKDSYTGEPVRYTWLMQMYSDELRRYKTVAEYTNK